jgi:hypothetical protein
MSSPDCSVFTRCFLVTASNNGYSSSSVLRFSLNGGSLQTELFFLQLSPLYLLCKDRIENTVSSSTHVVACIFFAAGTCLPSRFLEAALVYLVISRSLHSNGSTRYNNLNCNSNVTKHTPKCHTYK